MKITTDDLKQIIKEELKEGYLSGTAEESILAMNSKVRELYLMLRQADDRGIDSRYPEEAAKVREAYREFNMAYQALEGKVRSYISG